MAERRAVAMKSGTTDGPRAGGRPARRARPAKRAGGIRPAAGRPGKNPASRRRPRQRAAGVPSPGASGGCALSAKFAGIALAEHKENMVYNRPRVAGTPASAASAKIWTVEQPKARSAYSSSTRSHQSKSFSRRQLSDSRIRAARRARSRARGWVEQCMFPGEEPYSRRRAARSGGRPKRRHRDRTEVLRRAQGSDALDAVDNRDRSAAAIL